MARYLTVEEVLRIHAVMIKRYGGSEGVRDLGLIEAAIARPSAGFGDHEAYPDIFMKAAVLLHSLVKNYGFVDGNKRTALTACGTFLILNEYLITANEQELVNFTVSIAKDKLTEAQIADWLKHHTKPVR